MLLAALLTVAPLFSQPAPAPSRASSLPKDVAPVTVSPTPTKSPSPDVRITIGGDMDHISNQDVLIWPTGARQAGLDGDVTLSCHIDVHGLAEWCRVVSETPPGRGFGRAALALRPVLKVAPRRDSAGVPFDAMLNIAVAFRNGEASSNLTYVLGRGNDAAGSAGSDNRFLESGAHDVNPRNLLIYGNPLEMRSVTLLDSRVWAAAPDFAELTGAYPAEGGGVEGFAVAHCKTQSDGTLKGCVVAREVPARHGFGKAALALAPRFRLSPDVMAQAPRGAPVEADVPIRFPTPAEAADRTVRAPVWLPGYDPETQIRSFPTGLAKPSSPGARVKCEVGSDGALTGCAIELTSPDGLDFDAAAVAYASHLKMSLWSAEDGPVRGGVVHLPVRLPQP